MTTFRNFIASHFNLEMPSGNIPGTWFAENGLPMVVSCTCCGMTMVAPSAFVDDDGSIYCGDCSGYDYEDEDE